MTIHTSGLTQIVEEELKRCNFSYTFSCYIVGVQSIIYVTPVYKKMGHLI